MKKKKAGTMKAFFLASRARNSGFSSMAAQFTGVFSLIRRVRLGMALPLGKTKRGEFQVSL